MNSTPDDSDTAGIADCESCGDRLTAETMSYVFPELCIDCAEEVGADEEPSVGVTRMLDEEWYTAYKFRTSTGLIAFDARGDTIPEALRALADQIEGTGGPTDDALKPLAEGEHVDLDTGVEVSRGTTAGSCMFNIRDDARDQRISLEDEEIRQLAELAGYEVTEGSA